MYEFLNALCNSPKEIHKYKFYRKGDRRKGHEPLQCKVYINGKNDDIIRGVELLWSKIISTMMKSIEL